jgi:hypothetical protein
MEVFNVEDSPLVDTDAADVDPGQLLTILSADAVISILVPRTITFSGLLGSRSIGILLDSGALILLSLS